MVLDLNKGFDMLKNNKGFKECHFEILDSMADSIRIIDNDDNVIYSNDILLDDLPVDQHTELYKKNWTTSNNKTKNGKNQEKFTFRNKRIKGRDFSMQASPVFNQEEEVIGFIEVFRDITREKNMERALREKSLDMHSDLQFAKTIQRKILPSKGKFGNVEVDYLYRPSQYLSGDIFDIYEIDDKHLGFYMVDVAGHGIAASMMTVFIRQSMQSIYQNSVSPSDTLNKISKKFQELNLEADRYFTMFCGVYNIEKMEFKYANAGHNSIPFLFNKDNKIMMLANYGYPILTFPTDDSFNEESVTMLPGDSILLYTDGIIEARNSNGEEFGEDRLKKCILHSKGSLLSEIEEKFDKFIDLEQKDDFALLLIEVK